METIRCPVRRYELAQYLGDGRSGGSGNTRLAVEQSRWLLIQTVLHI